MKTISAEEAKGRTLEVIDSHMGDDLNQIMEAIEEAINEGKFLVVLSRILAFPEQLLNRLKELGYKVEYGTTMVRNETYEDKGKLIINWG